MPRVPFLCLANSRKYGGRCLAGIRLDTGQWLRPVSDLPGGELLPEHTCYPDGSQPRVLDRLELAVLAPAPRAHHPEDWIIAPGGHRPLGAGLDEQTARMVAGLLEAGPEIFGNRGSRVPFEAFQNGPLPASLALVRPLGLLLHIEEKEEGDCTRRKVRASFRHGGVEHRMAVTDPAWERALEKRPAGIVDPRELGLLPDQELLLTISLSEPFGEVGQQSCYKLIAAMIPLFRGVLPSLEPECASPGQAAESPGQLDEHSEPDGVARNQGRSGLLEELRQWRNTVAQKEGVPPHFVAHAAHLEALVAYRPRTLEGLGRVPGFGPARLEKYGLVLLSILTRHQGSAAELLDAAGDSDADALRALELRAARLEREMKRLARELARLKAERSTPAP